MRLFVARHGESVWNAENNICGRTDIPLNENGVKQAQRLAERLKDKKIDLIISSPLSRARATSEEIAKVCKVPIIIDERIIEQDYGIYNGGSNKAEGLLENKHHFAYRYPNGESMMQVACRAYSLIDEVKEKYSNLTVLLVCHGAVGRVINTYFNDMTNDEFYNFLLPNADFVEYSL